MYVITILIAMVIFIAPIAILAAIVSASVKKTNGNKSSFEHSVRNVYIYLILIISIIGIIFGSIATIRLGLDLILPEEPLYSQTSNYREQEKNENIVEFFTLASVLISLIPVFTSHSKLAKSMNVNKKQSKDDIKP